MWRNLTRSFQQGLKRSLGFAEKSDTCIKDGKGSSSNNPKCITTTELLPGAFDNVNRCLFKVYGDQGQGDYYQRSNNIGQHTFFEAFGWSGALVFGWIISKQFWLSHTWTRDRDEQNEANRCPRKRFVELITLIVKTQPPVSFVLPQLQTTQAVKSNQGNEGKLPSDLDEEFDTAAKELQEVHNRAIAEALNRRGISCLSKSTASEAFKYFQKSSDLNYAPASFNMGQCCELGIGTKQDFKKAAEWYTIASNQGHATAMYNLGVFYAHGWGGLQANIETAKHLFGKAAKLGQPDAKAALDKEFKSKNALISLQKTKEIKAGNQLNSQEMDLIINSMRSGLTDDVFQRGFAKDKHWNIPINSTVAF
uniref:Uncharacterized protein n=1 Tax=Homalodisca liturata TaxID=320908 RepID=A0A1B6I4Q3_9HEMI